MKSRARQLTREDGRHWLPSQGVDPAPLAELNAECLGQLVERAIGGRETAPVPSLLRVLRNEWAALPADAVRRLATAPFSLFDAGFAAAPLWLAQRTRGVHDAPR